MTTKSPTQLFAQLPPYKSPSTPLFRTLPVLWIPYAELMRLNRPAGFCAFYWHYAIGLSFAACISTTAPEPLGLTTLAAYFGVWFLLLRGTVFTVNNNLDQSFDRKVARTRHRSIAGGAVSSRQANWFAVAQLLVAATMVFPLDGASQAWADLEVVMLSVYSLAKRVTDFRQVVLGFGLALPAILCCAALGTDAVLQGERLNADVEGQSIVSAEIYLYLTGVLWTVIFNTVYVHQDIENIEDDKKAGVKSLAVRLGDRTKIGCAVLEYVQVWFLWLAGKYAGFGLWYYVFSCGGTALSLSGMLLTLDLKKPESCAWCFGPGSRFVRFSVVIGLLGTYVSRLDLPAVEYLIRAVRKG
ncbi:MAG: hypothetical protein MMC23_002953 [Stictis urceolatum]|nr:hypothetical protein [Stictis urceolata]